MVAGVVRGLTNHDIGSNGGRKGGDEARARALRNNGFCECAPLGGECGCTKWRKCSNYCESASPRLIEEWRCPAPLCCASGVCAVMDRGELEQLGASMVLEYSSELERDRARQEGNHPKCYADPAATAAAAEENATAAAAEENRPSCNCCDAAKWWCNNVMLFCAFTVMALCYICLLYMNQIYKQNLAVCLV